MSIFIIFTQNHHLFCILLSILAIDGLLKITSSLDLNNVKHAQFDPTLARSLSQTSVARQSQWAPPLYDHSFAAAAAGPNYPHTPRGCQSGHTPMTMMPQQTPMVPFMPPGAQFAQFIDIEAAMYKDRTLMISRFIDDNAANSIISILLYLRKESYRDPISIYLNVPGGWLRPSLAVYDLIQNTKQNCVVETVNLGLCAGMGSILASAGTKGRRSCMPNGRFILQRTGINQVFRGQATDIALEVKNNKIWNDRMEQELSLLTGQPLQRIHDDLKRDFYLTSDEAVQYGLIDTVLLPSPRKRAARGQDADLGAFEGDDGTKYQTKDQGGGWGSRRPAPQQPDERKNDDYEPKIAKG